MAKEKELDKDKMLDQVLADIEKQFGKGAIMRLGSNDSMEIDVSSTGSISLDVALGVGGYPGTAHADEKVLCRDKEHHYRSLLLFRKEPYRYNQGM